MSVWLIVIIVIAAVILFVIVTYNGLITLKNRVQEAASDIDVQLKRRFELIPNLVNTVKGYAKHETELFEKVTKERASMANGSTADKINSSNQLSETLKSLFAVAEAYPDLKANQNFLQMQADLTDTQDKIMASQRFYNANVRDFNTKLQVFPTNIYGKQLGFTQFEFIEAADAEKQNVKVEF
ncbi:MAG: LemA family protein [bacterium]